MKLLQSVFSSILLMSRIYVYFQTVWNGIKHNISIYVGQVSLFTVGETIFMYVC